MGYTEISSNQDCCRRSGKIRSVRDRERPAQCEAECDAVAGCTHFSHSTRYHDGLCVLCSQCTTLSGAPGNGQYYSSWRKGATSPAPPPIVSAAWTDLPGGLLPQPVGEADATFNQRCMRVCSETADCAGFELVASGCRLKRVEVGGFFLPTSAVFVQRRDSAGRAATVDEMVADEIDTEAELTAAVAAERVNDDDGGDASLMHAYVGVGAGALAIGMLLGVFGAAAIIVHTGRKVAAEIVSEIRCDGSVVLKIAPSHTDAPSAPPQNIAAGWQQQWSCVQPPPEAQC